MSDLVLIGGVFDPLHAGHLAYIREAQTHGRVLCVLSDNPGKHPPLVPRAERAKLLCALGCVVVGSHSEQTVAWWLENLKPRKYIKGKDWEGRLPPEEVAICISLGIEMVYTDTSRQSSSQLLAQYERQRNAEKLAAFEAWVSQQTPAEKPWEPVTDYSFEAREAIEGPHAEIIRDTFQPLRLSDNTVYGTGVLDAGCGRHGILVRLLRDLDVDAVGFDAQAEEVTDPVYSWRLMLYRDDILTAESDRGFGVVICREVLEHLTAQQVAVAVRNLVKLSSRYVYVTTRFTSKPHILDFDVADRLDPTHCTMLNQDLLRMLFVLEGCRRRADLEAKLDHRNLGRVLVYEVAA